MKPLKTYQGGKGADGTYQAIINQIPPHAVYIEGCLGNGSIMSKKKPAPVLNIGIDADNEIISKWGEFPHFTFNYVCLDIIEYLSDHQNIADLLAMGNKVFIYLDPPYPESVRKSKRKIYRVEMLENAAHERLLNAIIKLDLVFKNRVFIMITSYKNALYDQILKDWRQVDFKAKTRKGSVIETMYCNYDQPEKLHDYRYLGNDNRERFRISQRVKRNVERLQKMPTLERNAIITAIKEKI